MAKKTNEDKKNKEENSKTEETADVSTEKADVSTEESKQPQPKKGKLKKLILTVIGAILVLIAAAGLWAYFGTNQAATQAEEFVEDVVSGNYDEAYGQFSPALKKVQSREQFESQAETVGFDESCELKVEGREVSKSTETGDRQVIEGQVECDEESFDAKFTYVDVNSELKLISYFIQPK